MSSTRNQIPLHQDWTAVFYDASTFEELPLDGGSQRSETVDIPFLRASPSCNAAVLSKSIHLSVAHEDSFWLCFGAAMMAVRVFINGKMSGEHRGGYTPFEFDISSGLQEGRNQIVIQILGEQAAITENGISHPVSVSSATLSGRALAAWQKETGLDTPPCRFGIWQEVYLEQRSRTFLQRLMVTSDLVAGELCIKGSTSSEKTCTPDLQWQITDTDQQRVDTGTLELVCESGQTEFNFRVSAAGLKTWSPDSPTLYQIEFHLLLCNKVVDTQSKRFGYRSFEIDEGDFKLNGSPITLRGESNFLQNRGLQFTNPFSLESPEFWEIHHCRAYLKLLKEELDVNCLRVHGSIGHPAIFDAADEVGVLLLNQSSIWSRGYGGYKQNFEPFKRSAAAEIEAWVWRDASHPSVIIWGAENEMARIAPNPSEARNFLFLNEEIRRWDTSRPISNDGSSGAMGEAAEIYHFHHEETYAPMLANWKRDKPIVFGEFWIGSRGAEQRLTTGEEYYSQKDYQEKQWEHWRNRIEPMRMAGASGVFPYNFSAQWIRSWSTFRSESNSRTRSWTLDEGMRVGLPDPDTAYDFRINQSLARKWRHLLGRYCVGFASPRRTLPLSPNGSRSVEVLVRNDSQAIVEGSVRLLSDQQLLAEAPAGAPPHTTTSLQLEIPVPSDSDELPVTLQWLNDQGEELDAVDDCFFPLSPKPGRQPTRPLFAKTSSSLKGVLESLDEHGMQTVPIQAGPIQWETLREAILIIDAESLHSIPHWRDRVNEFSVSLIVPFDPHSPATLFGVQYLNFDEPVAHDWKFSPVIRYPMRLHELLLPETGVWEAAAEDRAALKDRYWRGAAVGNKVAHGAFLFPGAQVSEVMRIVHNVGAGLDPDHAGSDPDRKPEVAPSHFRSLMGGSRREYSIVAEVSDGGPSSILTSIAFDPDPSQSTNHALLLAQMIDWLDTGVSPVEAIPFNQVELLDDCKSRSPEDITSFDPSLRLVEGEGADIVSIDNRTVFSATKSLELLQGDTGQSWLQVASADRVVGGWLGMRVPSCFEIAGPLFPWEFNSESPRELGYSGVAVLEGGTLKLALVDKLESGSNHHNLLLSNLNALRSRGIDVRVLECENI